MKLKNLAVVIIAAIMTAMIYMIGATVYSVGATAADEHGGHPAESGWERLVYGATTLEAGKNITCQAAGRAAGQV